MAPKKYSVIGIASVLYDVVTGVEGWNLDSNGLDYQRTQDLPPVPDLNTIWACESYLKQIETGGHAWLGDLPDVLFRLKRVLERTNDRTVREAWNLVVVRRLMES